MTTNGSRNTPTFAIHCVNSGLVLKKMSMLPLSQVEIAGRAQVLARSLAQGYCDRLCFFWSAALLGQLLR